MGKRDERKYREIFFAWNGPGPYECDLCKENVDFWSVLIHHKNHDEGDHRLVNLQPLHRGCHTRHHSLGRGAGKVVSEETKFKMSIAQIQRWANMSDEERSVIGKKAADTRAPIQQELLQKMWATRRKSG